MKNEVSGQRQIKQFDYTQDDLFSEKGKIEGKEMREGEKGERGSRCLSRNGSTNPPLGWSSA